MPFSVALMWNVQPRPWVNCFRHRLKGIGGEPHSCYVLFELLTEFIKIAGPYLVRYAQEAAWREDLRRLSNGVGRAMHCKSSVDFCGSWQRAQGLWYKCLIWLMLDYVAIVFHAASTASHISGAFLV